MPRAAALLIAGGGPVGMTLALEPARGLHAGRAQCHGPPPQNGHHQLS
jgi:hypothetical protein